MKFYVQPKPHSGERSVENDSSKINGGAAHRHNPSSVTVRCTSNVTFAVFLQIPIPSGLCGFLAPKIMCLPWNTSYSCFTNLPENTFPKASVAVKIYIPFGRAAISKALPGRRVCWLISLPNRSVIRMDRGVSPEPVA